MDAFKTISESNRMCKEISFNDFTDSGDPAISHLKTAQAIRNSNNHPPIPTRWPKATSQTADRKAYTIVVEVSVMIEHHPNTWQGQHKAQIFAAFR
jgi:hypothetical protein